MKLERVGKIAASGSKDSGDVIWVVQDGDTIVYVADLTQVANEVVVSRGLFGPVKEKMFKEAVARIISLLGDRLKIVHGWSNEKGVVEHTILRGGSHVHPDDLETLIGCPTIYTAQRWHRIRENGGWVAQPMEGTGVNLRAVRTAKSILIWEGCSAGGSTLESNVTWFKVNNPDLNHIVLFCPIMGDTGYRLVREACRRHRIRLTVICFGIYKVLPIGWESKPDTDIIIPEDHTAGDLLIPARQAEAYQAFYRPRSGDRNRPCLIGDMGEAMCSDPEKQEAQWLAYCQVTNAELCVRCHAPVPEAVIRFLREHT